MQLIFSNFAKFTNARAEGSTILGIYWREQCWSNAGAMLEQCWSNIGAMLEQCWSNVGAILDNSAFVDL